MDHLHVLYRNNTYQIICIVSDHAIAKKKIKIELKFYLFDIHVHCTSDIHVVVYDKKQWELNTQLIIRIGRCQTSQHDYIN